MKTHYRLQALVVGVIVALAVGSSHATVSITIKTNDGIIVAADSRITSEGGGKTRVASEYGEKVKQVGSHAAVTFAGAATLITDGGVERSIGSVVGTYKNNARISDSTYISPEDVANGLEQLLSQYYNSYQVVNCGRPRLEIVIAGYTDSGKAQCFELNYPNVRKLDSGKYEVYGVLKPSFSPGYLGVVPLGQTDVFTRLIKGYDPQLKRFACTKVVTAIVPDSVDSAVSDTTVDTLQLDWDEFRYDVEYGTMTLQDAIDFAVFIVRATIEAQRFNQKAVQGVGGTIDIAVITPDGFQWIQQKRLHGEGGFESSQANK